MAINERLIIGITGIVAVPTNSALVANNAMQYFGGNSGDTISNATGALSLGSSLFSTEINSLLVSPTAANQLTKFGGGVGALAGAVGYFNDVTNIASSLSTRQKNKKVC